MAVSEIGRVTIGAITGMTHDIPDGVFAGTMTGWTAPRPDALQVIHQGEVNRHTNAAGDIVRVSHSGEFLEAQITFIPDHETSEASAKQAASLPKKLASVEISGLPIVAMGEFSDCWNTNGNNTQDWVYEEGTLRFEKPDQWVIDMTIRRYYSITTAIAS